MLIALILVLILFGGLGSFHAYNNWGTGSGLGLGGVVLLLVIVLLFGRGRL